jgi:acyl-CoA thioesterase FadM
VTSTVDTATSVLRASPGYEGANVRTWIGFKHFTYLVEAAVLRWFRDRGVGPGRLYHEHGLGLSIVDCSLLLPAVLDVDDEVVAEATEVRPGRFTVRLSVARDTDVTVCRAKVGVALVREPAAPAHRPVPPWLAALVVDRVGAADPIPLPPGADPVAALTDGDPRAFGWTWRVPYFYCQYSQRLAHAGYVRALEEVVDRFLADRGISVGRLLRERGWIPVVSRSRVTLLADAYMEEEMITTFRVEDVLRGVTYDARMDCHVVRDCQLVPVATGRILHGYAISRGPDAGTLAEFDAPVLAALTGGAR